MGQYFLVELEFKRVQTYLFAVPYLKEMIGANTILGETIRGVWSSKNKAFMNFSSEEKPEEEQFKKVDNYELIDNLPALAQNCGSVFPEVGKKLIDRVSYKELSNIISNKKQEDKFYYKESYQDDVLEVAENTGILVRDGGHFEAVFLDESSAENFVLLAEGLISRKLPGLIVERRIKPFKEDVDGKIELIKDISDKKRYKSESLFDLPQFEDCEYSGVEPAFVLKENKKEENKIKYIGESSNAKQNAAERFYKKESKDVLGILNKNYNCIYSPNDFNEIGKHSEDHIAVIHADGNDVGARLRGIDGKNKEKDYIDRWLKRESFFYSIRSGVRAAFFKSIEAICNEFKSNKVKKEELVENSLMLMPLMLGGDDILIVTPASIAFDFVSVLAKNIKENTSGISSKEGEENPLTIGAGILVCKSSFPFYKAYELSEELATSAKKLKTVYPEHSYVDWEILSESWHSGIAETRSKQYVSYKNDETLIFSGKPYVISNSQKDCVTMDNIIEAAKKLEKDTARNQFKYLYERIPDGRHKLRLLFDELPNAKDFDEFKDIKNYLLNRFPDGSFSGYIRVEKDIYLTRLGDLIEIMETRRRGDKNE